MQGNSLWEWETRPGNNFPRKITKILSILIPNKCVFLNEHISSVANLSPLTSSQNFSNGLWVLCQTVVLKLWLTEYHHNNCMLMVFICEWVFWVITWGVSYMNDYVWELGEFADWVKIEDKIKEKKNKDWKRERLNF